MTALSSFVRSILKHFLGFVFLASLVFGMGCKNQENTQRELARDFLNAVSNLDWEKVNHLSLDSCPSIQEEIAERNIVPGKQNNFIIEKTIPEKNGVLLTILTGKKRSANHLRLNKTESDWKVNCEMSSITGVNGILSSLIRDSVIIPKISETNPQWLAEDFFVAMKKSDVVQSKKYVTTQSLPELLNYFSGTKSLDNKTVSVIGTRIQQERAEVSFIFENDSSSHLLNLEKRDSVWKVIFTPQTAIGNDPSFLKEVGKWKWVISDKFVCRKGHVLAHGPGFCPVCRRPLIPRKIKQAE